MSNGLHIPVLLGLVLGLTSLVYAQPPAADPVKFNRDIRPLLSENCFKCHGPDAKQRKAGLRLDDPASATVTLESGARAVVPGARAESALWARITAVDPDERMPPPESKKTLTPEQIELFGRWIDEGAPFEPHWAFIPPQSPTPPAVMDTAWPRNEIDRFVLSAQEGKGLAPNATADRRVLIRRAYLDVLGLPPPPDAVEAFVNDPAPDAYVKVVNALLENPHFGERWARHWLDVARFAESHGYEQDYDRPYAYHYRDFVINAFNQDLPYSDFVRWQIAGDELAPDNPLALAATGFLGAGTHATQITKSQVEKERYDELDDMARTTSLTFLGLTLGCARCHDHKYDPIPTEDYYRLVSTFTTTVRADMDIVTNAEEYQAACVAFMAEHAPLADEVAAYEREVLRPQFNTWLQNGAAQPAMPDWIVLEFDTLKSEHETAFARLDDGSYRVVGRNKSSDTYTLSVKAPNIAITGFRIEALRDPALMNGGPGRGETGNFSLSRFAAALKTKDVDKVIDLALVNARATYEGAGSSIAGTVDDDGGTGWTVAGEEGKSHTALFDLGAPITPGPDDTLTISLQFKMKGGENLGRFRITATTKTAPLVFDGTTVTQATVDALANLRGSVNPQSDALFAYYRQLDPTWRALQAKVDAHEQQAPVPQYVRMMICSEGVPAIRTHTQGGDYLEQTHFLQRGDPNQKGEVATQGFVHALMRAPESQWQVTAPQGSPLSFRRTSLANWLTDFDHGAGFLLARVVVNRLWQYHFGRGIVSTASDFGFQGTAPTHPELLDWLVLELVQHEWSLKHIHRLIMKSATYRQASLWDEAKGAIDHDNALWWRFPPRRLEVESIRDSMLAVSGMLDETMFGPGTLDAAQTRRSIYFMVKRSKLIPMMMLFDAPDTTQSLGARATTTIAPQALLLMNNVEVRKWAEAFAKR
ncbi:MAG: PSD1 domain-containing protein, partial [Candidatus Hydrogenedentes bacterium]|nr:PSD1 domain-containing protein [Candidatus Hydrogenedentota bacterium]